MSRLFWYPPTLLGAALLIAACANTAGPADHLRQVADTTTQPQDTTSTPSVAGVAGNYEATTFTASTTGGTVDLLALGGKLTLVLDTSGATTGRLFVPNGDEDGGDFDESMAGSWTLSADTVRFQQTADTFVRDMPFTVAGDKLNGKGSWSGTEVTVVLTKIGAPPPQS